MKYNYLLIVIAVLLTACESPYIFNRVVKKSNGEREMLGGVNREIFAKEPFSDWFSREYDAYQPNQKVTAEFKSKIKRFRIEAFIGSWNEDTRREYPRFIKILDEVKFPDQRLLTYAVNENLKSFYSEEAGKNIRHLPTFVLYKGGKEVGRIVESPVSGSLEEDLLMLINQQELIPNYTED